MSYNRAIIIGRLTKAPERKATNSGKSVCNFVVAVDRGYKDQDGNTQTDFLSVVVWGKTAEFVCSYFTKGQWIGIDGAVQTREYIDKEGNKRKAVEIRAERVFFVGDKKDSGGGQKPATDDYSRHVNDVVIDDTEDIPF